MALTAEGTEALGFSVEELGSLVGPAPFWIRTAELPTPPISRAQTFRNQTASDVQKAEVHQKADLCFLLPVTLDVSIRQPKFPPDHVAEDRVDVIVLRAKAHYPILV